jgi:hypothetical protein
MVYKIIISTEAEEDTIEAYTFYEDQQSGLGDRFHLFPKKKLRVHFR